MRCLLKSMSVASSGGDNTHLIHQSLILHNQTLADFCVGIVDPDGKLAHEVCMVLIDFDVAGGEDFVVRCCFSHQRVGPVAADRCGRWEPTSSPAETSAIRLPVIRHPQLHEDRIDQSLA